MHILTVDSHLVIPRHSRDIVEYILGNGHTNVPMQIVKRHSPAVLRSLVTKTTTLGLLKKQRLKQRLVYDRIEKNRLGLLRVSTRKQVQVTRHHRPDSKLLWD